MKPASTSADATLSFAEFKPTPGKGGRDATVSLAETPARVQVGSPRATPAANPLPAGSPRPKPAAAPQGKTLFGLPTVAMPARETPASPALAAAAAASAAAAKAAAAASALPAVGPRASNPSVVKPTATEQVARESKVVLRADPPASTRERAPSAGAFAANTPAVSKASPPLVGAASREVQTDRTEEVSLSELSPAEPSRQVESAQVESAQIELAQVEAAAPEQDIDADVAASEHDEPPVLETQVPSIVVSEQRAPEPESHVEASVAEVRDIPRLRNAPSTEPAPRPRGSALKYVIMAAVPVGLCAAWFVLRSADVGTTHATEVALKSEQVEASGTVPQQTHEAMAEAKTPPPAAAEPSAPAPAADQVPAAAEGTPAVAAATPEPAATPTEGAVGPSAMAPGAEPSAQAAAPAEEAAAEVDPDDEDADMEIDASRKAVAARAEKLVSEGHALRKKKKLAPARAKYRDALVIYPGYPRALAGLVQVSIAQRDGKAAVNLAKQLVKLRPGQLSYQVLLGDAYKVAGKAGLAKEAWQAAARKGSGAAKARLGE